MSPWAMASFRPISPAIRRPRRGQRASAQRRPGQPSAGMLGYLIITDSSTERTLCMHDATPGSWVVSRDGYRKQMAFFPYSLLTTLSTSIKSHENALLNFDTRVQDR